LISPRQVVCQRIAIRIGKDYSRHLAATYNTLAVADVVQKLRKNNLNGINNRERIKLKVQRRESSDWLGTRHPCGLSNRPTVQIKNSRFN